jgi:hypothetical protein
MIGPNPDSALKRIAALPFVRGIRLLNSAVDIKTPGGRYRLSVEVKRSYLDRSILNTLTGQARKKGKGTDGRLLIARYVPAALGEQLVDAGISFVDDPGNLHLQLGAKYSWTILGKREPRAMAEAERTTPATIQLLFQFATTPESAAWTVRDLERSAGVSRTRTAQIRSQFIREHLLMVRAKKTEFDITPQVADRLVAGYNQILRPKLVLGRYRFQDSSPEEFVARLSREAAKRKLRYALTGGPAADAMQHYYRGSDVPVFLNAEDARGLRLLPDRNGPVMLLRPFGELIYWREFEARMVAPPWLVYAELLNSSDPRAREAAEELRGKFLV